MSPLIPFALGSLKALILLLAAATLTAALRKGPARLRVVVWSTSLAGSLLIPLATPILPQLSLPIPEAVADIVLAPTDTRAEPGSRAPAASPLERTGRPVVPGSLTSREPSRSNPSVAPWLVAIWAVGAAAALAHLGGGLRRVARTLKRARVVSCPHWQEDLAWAAERVGCRRPVRLLWGPEVRIPATVGLIRPTLLLPAVAMRWDRERREAVLLHELIHVSRCDWPLRIVARLARAGYWFNPLVWWAVRRLDLEQELACDEEVVALGTKPSSYACHLLGIARALTSSPAQAAQCLHFIRRSHLEERIMTILSNRSHRRLGLAVLAPAAILVAALVPALAAVAPTDPTPASPEIKRILAEIREAEANIQPQLDRIHEIELEMAPRIEALDQIDIQIDHDAMAAIEEQMKPHLERLEQIEIDIEPHLARIEEIELEMQDLELHIGDGTLDEIQRQIEEQLELVHERMEDIHLDMEPFHQQMEEIQRQLEPLHKEMAKLHVDMEPIQEEIERIHEAMKPFHERLEDIHLDMEPFQEEMERLSQRLNEALRDEVAGQLRQNLGPVTAPDAPFNEAAARVIEVANIHVDDDLVRIDAPRPETRQILRDLFSPLRIGGEASFETAVNSATSSLSPMVISIK